jgi:dsDNA-specific endonuclease/ATPase MutS2
VRVKSGSKDFKREYAKEILRENMGQYKSKRFYIIVKQGFKEDFKSKVLRKDFRSKVLKNYKGVSP